MGCLEVILGNKKEKQLFELFNAAADHIVQAQKIFGEFCKNSAKYEYAAALRLIEHKCDQTIKQIFDILDSVSHLPFHHDDIAEFAKKLDSIVDLIWGAADRIIFRYKLSDIEKEKELLNFIPILEEMTVDIKNIILNLNKLGKIRNLSKTISKFHELENEADDLRAAAIQRWHFESLNNPRVLALRIAWAEVYDRLEWTTNICVDIIDIVESFLKKYF